MPKISVVVTTYNRKEYLTQTINSILNQTFQDFELIIVDNFSEYAFFDLIKSFNSAKIKAFQNQNNGIIAVNRNYGINQTKGEFIAFCDDDDLWKPQKLEITLKYTIDYDLIYHGLDAKYPGRKNKRILKGRTLQSPIFENLLLKQNAIPNSSVCVKKDILLKVKGYSEDPQLIAVEDFDLWLKISKITEKFKHIPINLGEYTISDTNTSRNYEKQIQRLIKIYEIHTPFLTSVNSKRTTATLNYLIAKLKFQNKNYNDAYIYFRKALLHSNSSIKLKTLFYLIKAAIKKYGF